MQRPLWASTFTKDPNFPDTLYVDNLIGPDTVNTLPEGTLEAFVDHGTVARTIDTRVGDSLAVMTALSTVGVDMDDVGRTLEAQGIAAFNASVAHVLGTLEVKSRAYAPQRALVSSATGHGEPHEVHAPVGEPLINSDASNQLSKVGADEQADRTACIQSVAEPSGGGVGANEGD